MIGLGNTLRHDDGAGVEVIRRLARRATARGIAVHEHHGEPLALLDLWEGARAAVLVDAARSGAPAGTVRRFEASERPLPTALRGSSSTHALSVAEAIELARALGRLPERLVLLTVEGRLFDAGSGFSAQVEAALDSLAEAALREARRLSSVSCADAGSSTTARHA